MDTLPSLSLPLEATTALVGRCACKRTHASVSLSFASCSLKAMAAWHPLLSCFLHLKCIWYPALNNMGNNNLLMFLCMASSSYPSGGKSHLYTNNAWNNQDLWGLESPCWPDTWTTKDLLGLIVLHWIDSDLKLWTLVKLNLYFALSALAYCSPWLYSSTLRLNCLRYYGSYSKLQVRWGENGTSQA